jgi:RNA polymerase-binding transcription factor DksA
MSKTKDEIEEAELDWHALAQAKGYRCETCGSIIPYEERKAYFSTNLCDWCRNQREKDD